MEFRYGISPRSLVRLRLFERILELHAERSPEVGQGTMTQIVDAELAAIERPPLSASVVARPPSVLDPSRGSRQSAQRQPWPFGSVPFIVPAH